MRDDQLSRRRFVETATLAAGALGPREFVASSWADLVVGLSVLLSQTERAKVAAVDIRGNARTLLESSTPLSVLVQGQTVVEPAIVEVIGLVDFMRAHT